MTRMELSTSGRVLVTNDKNNINVALVGNVFAFLDKIFGALVLGHILVVCAMRFGCRLLTILFCGSFHVNGRLWKELKIN